VIPNISITCVGTIISEEGGDPKSRPFIFPLLSLVKRSLLIESLVSAYLDWHLSALTELTCCGGWHDDDIVDELLPCLMELTNTFHVECGKNGASFMGLSITRSSVVCLNHLLNESFANISTKVIFSIS